MKVKFGVNTLVWIRPFSENDMYIIEKLSDMGFDVIEITPGDEYQKLDPVKLRKKLDDAGLEASLCGVFDASKDISSEDPGIRQNGINYMKEYTAYAHELGVKIIAGPLYSEVDKKRYIPDQARKAEWERSADSLKRIGDDAIKKGVIIALEPINRFETDMINTAEQACQMCEQVNNSSIKMMLDTAHMSIEEKKFGEAIRASKKHLVHMHLCSNDRGIPGDGHIPWKEVNKALHDIDYNGYGVIESFPQGQVAI